MRLKGRQARFLLVTLSLWTLVRAVERWPGGEASRIAADIVPIGPADMPSRTVRLFGGTPAAPFEPWAGSLVSPPPSRVLPLLLPALIVDAGPIGQANMLLLRTFGSGSQLAPQAILRRLVYASLPEADDRFAPADAAPAAAGLLRPTFPSKPLALDAYLFVRPGSGRAALSPAGQLGGSQFAARASYRVAEIGPFSLAAVARAYVPLESRGAEAAAGLDLRLQGSAPMRLSIERRQRIDRAGRSAWSAYVAGGFYRETHGIVLDGYGQAGVVGLRRGDLFVDGALRAGRKASDRLVVGGAIWGAAQPGVARLDVGPRVAWRLPIADQGLTLAIEGRFRVAGQARPGSGAALTLAADF